MLAGVWKNNKNDMSVFCKEGQKLIDKNRYDKCRDLITETMKEYPDAPEPHNMMGILLEKEGNHLMAMRHFRAAWALDPGYAPARKNLENFGTFQSESGMFS